MFFMGAVVGAITMMLLIVAVNHRAVVGFKETGYFIKFNGVIYELTPQTADKGNVDE